MFDYEFQHFSELIHQPHFLQLASFTILIVGLCGEVYEIYSSKNSLREKVLSGIFLFFVIIGVYGEHVSGELFEEMHGARHLNAEIKDKLKKVIVHGFSVSVMATPLSESRAFASEIARELSQIGENVKEEILMTTRTPEPIGIEITYDHRNSVAGSIFSAFQEAGLNPIDGGQPGNPFMVVVYVGTKP